jgi:hypothetical protein
VCRSWQFKFNDLAINTEHLVGAEARNAVGVAEKIAEGIGWKTTTSEAP